jgi:hypothetical protein
MKGWCKDFNAFNVKERSKECVKKTIKTALKTDIKELREIAENNFLLLNKLYNPEDIYDKFYRVYNSALS